nr:hypothetical protein [Hoylesella enoeca]
MSAFFRILPCKSASLSRALPGICHTRRMNLPVPHTDGAGEPFVDSKQVVYDSTMRSMRLHDERYTTAA